MRFLYLESQNTSSAFKESCFALTPSISTPKESEVFLDIGSTSRSFGSETQQMKTLETIQASFGWNGNQTLVDRPEWARPLTLNSFNYFPPGFSQNALWKLSIKRLPFCGNPFQIDSEIPERQSLAQFMQKVGVHTIGDFCAMGKAPIQKRFGKMGVELKEWAKGEHKLVLPLWFPNEPILESLEADGIYCLESLLNLMHEALLRIEARLRGRCLEALELELVFHLEDSPDLICPVRFSRPLQDSKTMLVFLRDFLASVKWDSPLVSLDLKVSQHQKFSAGQLNLFDGSEQKFEELSQFTQKLRYQFGETHVGVAENQNEHLPEKSWALRVPASVIPRPGNDGACDRPSFLFSPARKLHSISPKWKLTPTEKLWGYWWDKTQARTYFSADTPEGERLWVFWDETSHQWYLHGQFE